MPFNDISEYADFRSNGAWQQSTYFRTTTPLVGVAGRWADLSVGAGLPTYNPYAGTSLAATALSNINGNRAVYTGPIPAPGQTKHLHTLTVDTTGASVPSTTLLCDYLLYYPFIDLETTDIQVLDNTQSLPRYQTGEGVQCFVVTQVPTAGANINALCTVTYTNAAGVSGRTTTFALLGSPVIGALLNAGSDAVATTVVQASPFIPLAPGDTGIRSIQSVSIDAAIGGLAAFVLVYTIASIPQFTQVTQVEKTFFSRTGRAPQIEDSAFLHFLRNAGATTAPGTFRSSLTFVWG